MGDFTELMNFMNFIYEVEGRGDFFYCSGIEDRGLVYSMFRGAKFRTFRSSRMRAECARILGKNLRFCRGG
jgi:hypothetical protein